MQLAVKTNSQLTAGQRALYMVQVISVIDAIIAVFSFSFFLTLIFFLGNEDEQALMSPAHFFLVGGKEAAKHLTESNRAVFRIVFASIVVLIALAIHTVQIFMAWILYRAVRHVKQDPVYTLKTFERWRSWSVILQILLVTGIVAFSFGLFGHSGSRWVTVTFLLIQISFQLIAIYYIGTSARLQREVLQVQGRALSITTLGDTNSVTSVSRGARAGMAGNGKVDWKILYKL